MSLYGASITILDLIYSYDSTADIMMFTEPDSEFTTAEKSELQDWLAIGGKTLWLSRDSDYGGFYLPANVNSLLEYLGAHLRITAESLEDPESNAGAAYRVLANETGTSDIAQEITAGVNQVVFHGPTAVAGYDNGLVDLRTTNIPDVDVIMSSSAAGYIYDADNSSSEYDFYSGITSLNGSYPVLVMEKIGNSYLIVSGESVFADYHAMYGSVSEIGQPVEGDHLVDQLLNYCLDFTVDNLVPIITSPGDINYVEGETGNEISWTATDASPGVYAMFLDGALIQSGDWYSGTPITVSVDGLSVGTHNYTIEISDTQGYSVYDQVNVIVSAKGDDGSTIDPVYSPLSLLISSGALLGLVIYTRKKR
jgi:hypothetical protein